MPTADKNCSLCLNYANNVVYVEHSLSFWQCEILVHARQRVLHEQPPVSTLVSELLISFPGTQYFTCIDTTNCWDN